MKSLRRSGRQRLDASRPIRSVGTMSKKLRIPILMFLLFIVAMLFLTDFLMGRIHHEFENPFSRAAKTVETRYGFTRTTPTEPPNEMELFVANELKQPIAEKWVRSGKSYVIPRFSFRREDDMGDLPPVTTLKPRAEADFLHYIPQHPKIQFAVITSLFTPRREGSDAESDAHNKNCDVIEKKRVRLIINWDQYVRNDPTIIPDQWWRQNAAVFGLTPDGDPLGENLLVNKSAVLPKRD